MSNYFLGALVFTEIFSYFKLILKFTSNIWDVPYRWIGLAGEILADFVVLFTVIFAVIQRDALSAGLAGLAVTYSLQVRPTCIFFVYCFITALSYS